MTPKVDTFQQDIADEIKRKDASLADISAASNNIGNHPEDTAKKPAPVFLITLVTLFIFGMFGIVGLAYFYFTDSLLPPSAQSVEVTPDQVPKIIAALPTLSSTLNTQIGRYVTAVEKKDTGYIITINSYSPVFSYMVRNENEYIEELAQVISPAPLIATTTRPVAAASTIIQVASTTPKTTATTTATTTKTTTKTTSKTIVQSTKNATSTSTTTPVTSTTTQIVEDQVGPYFKDVTIANQNMRVWTSGKQVVVYAFITTEKIAISPTIEGILALKSAIIR